MKVFKFGGASVRNAKAVKNVGEIIQLFPNEKITIVISAMGKTTNAMELIVGSFCRREKDIFLDLVDERKTFHLSILNQLFEPNHNIFDDVNTIFSKLENRFEQSISNNFDFEYDQIVSLGEVLSTKIVNAYLQKIGLKSAWVDARKIIRTDTTFREGEVDWENSEKLISAELNTQFQNSTICVTQGFLGHTSDGFTTTLGREGSDYTAGIIAFCTNAKSVTIWKDVPGMLNADPKWFDDTVKLEKISFQEAIELSYYGASVIHPKTLKPLQNKGIPLYVKSFLNPSAEGTIIQQDTQNDELVPSFIFKKEQLLFSLRTKDFSFIVEKHLGDIFERLNRAGANINLMQNTALNFSVLLDEDKVDTTKLTELFSDDYFVTCELGLELITIRHYDTSTIDRVTVAKEVLVEQKIGKTARLVVKQS